jgi:hypothetical protein
MLDISRWLEHRPNMETPLNTHALPDPEVQPTVALWPTAGRALHLGRSSTYEAARKGEIPTIRIGGRIVALTAPLRRMLQLDEPNPGA